MSYTPENNPYIPGDPYSYDLKWMVNDIKHMEERFGELDDQVQEATDQADRSEHEADRAVEEANRSRDEADRADSEALVSEGYAKGTQDGEAVASGSPYFENNSKYYSEESAAHAQDSADSAAEAADYAAHIADPVAGIVAGWLADNVDPDTGYVIDKTLTIADAAADAEVTGNKIRAIEDSLQMVFEPASFYYPDQPGHGYYSANKRLLYPDIIPANSFITKISIPLGTHGVGAYIHAEIWEITDNTTMTKIFSVEPSVDADNFTLEIPVNVYSEKPCMVCFYNYGVQVFYLTGQTGKTFYYYEDTDPDLSTMSISSILSYVSMSLVGGASYLKVKEYATDFFSGWQKGNVVVMGDSTVDGSSTTGHTNNVIGTDRTAAAEPYVFTSIVENMLNTFTGGSTRIYNAGFGGHTLNYIADNYAAIMAAFTNVKSALLVIDVNSAGGVSRAEYADLIREGLERLITLLRKDNIAVAIASPQPMFYYPVDNSGLPALNSAAEFALAVNVGKDICSKYDIPFINLGELTNQTMASPYFKTTDFYGDRIHFGDGGHEFEAYELYGELIHPIVNFEYAPIYVNLDSNMGELAAKSDISAGNVNGYRSIILQADHVRTDVLHRIYVLAKAPFKIEGIHIEGWASNYVVSVDGSPYYNNEVYTGMTTITAGCHEITVTPNPGIVRYSGLIFSAD